MREVLAQLAQYGYVVLFSWVTAEQLGAPLPAVPILIAAGVLAGTGQLSFVAAFGLAILGCAIGDTAWYAIGKRRGPGILNTLCRISLEPETCVRRSSEFFARRGPRALWFAKFIPGVSVVAVPLAANSGVSFGAFLLNDLLGSAIYVGAYLALGALIGNRIERLDAVAGSLRSASVLFGFVGAAAIVGWRVQQRRRFHREVRMARITVEELRQLIDDGQSPFVVDLRHALDMLPDPRVIPGAIRFTPDELTERHQEIPRDREIILYCT